MITTGGTLEEAARRAVRALAEFDIAGVPTNTALLQAVLRAPGLGTHDVGWIDAHAAELAAVVHPPPPPTEPPDGDAGEPPGVDAAVRAPLAGTVVAVAVAPGDPVAPGDELLVIEAMKMEHEVRAQAAGLVREVAAAVGATVAAGEILVVLAESGADAAGQAQAERGPAGSRPAGPRRGAGAAPDRAGRGTARGDRAAPRRRTANGPGEHRRPGRPGQLHRVRRADHRGAAPPPPARRPHRAHPGRRAGPGHRDGRRPAGRGDVLRLQRAGRHPGPHEPPQDRPAARAGPTGSGCPWSCSPRAAAGGPATPTPPRWPASTCRPSG